MMRALYTGRSGIKNHQTRMDVVGNNISNVNTVGFKSGRATFADMLSQTLKNASTPDGNVGSTNPKQIGLGVNIGSIDTIFTDGAPLATDKNTDLCLSGDGLFIVKKGNETFYTRNGAFGFDGEGNYVMPGSGHFVQGWMANNGAGNGVIDTTGAVSNIKINQSISGQPTTAISFQENLGADSPFVTVGKVKKTETVYEDVNTRILEPQESKYNLNVQIGDDDYFLHVVQKNDINLDKNWKVKEVEPYEGYEWPITLEDDSGNTSHILVISKGSTNIKVGDAFSADTSKLRFKSTVNDGYPLEFSINGINYKAVSMNHSVEIPGEGWRVHNIPEDAGGRQLVISQYQNGSPDGCYVVITLDKEMSGNARPTVGDKLEFAGDVNQKSFKRAVTKEIEVDTATITGDTSSVPATTMVSIYDITGKKHQVPVYFFHEGELNNGTAQSTNKWLVSLKNDALVKQGDITSYEFVDAKGNKNSITMPVLELQFDDAGNLVTNSTSTMTLGNQSISVDFAKVTQLPSQTTVNATSNGEAGATLTDVQIDSSGIITGIYSNGVRVQEAQVAVAHFNNSAGLFKTGTSLYKESANSGNPLLIKAGEFGVSIMPGALEMSNVSLANEFSDMIITQRGFQSNSKLITVGDEMLETAINMKR